MRLGIAGHSSLLKNFSKVVVMVLGCQVPDSLAEIPQEAFARFGIFYNMTGQDGYPWSQVITSSGTEFRDHIVCPVLCSGFPAVGYNVLQSLFTHESACCILVLVEIVGEV